MLDYFLIFLKTGYVLFSKSFASESADKNIQNFGAVSLLITQVLAEEKHLASRSTVLGSVKFTWVTDNRFDIIFLAAHQNVLELRYIDGLLESVKRSFSDKYADQLSQISSSFPSIYFDDLFTSLLGEFDGSSREKPEVSSTLIALSLTMGLKPDKKSMRKWADKVTAEDARQLDFSNNSQPSQNDIQIDNNISEIVSKSKKAGFSVPEMEDERAGLETETNTFWSGLANRFSGKKAIRRDEIEPLLKTMKDNLVKKNVANDIAEKICETVASNLVDQPLGALESMNFRIKSALESLLEKILTPSTSTDLLGEIARAKEQRRSYSITFIGVNGVGKSTNLSKICFWLLQNRLSILVAACDTFRSGAVEQLGVHVRNLKKLDVSAKLELFQRGYGKDAASIAKEAIQYANKNGFDVVLIDTAGRMQNNEPLMRSLASLVSVNNPDKILFVGEALVGNEAVDQLTKFNDALRNFSGNSTKSQQSRQIDGIILTKFDTIDEKVGAALSMTHTTGKPILFIGTGQTYTDLKRMNIKQIVRTLTGL